MRSRTPVAPVATAVVLALLLAWGGVASAEESGGPGSSTPDLGKLDSGLQILAGAAAGDQVVTSDTGLGRGDATVVSGARVDEAERVLVDVHVSGDLDPVAAALRDLDMEVLAVGGEGLLRRVSGWVPADRLVDATAVSGVRAVTAVHAMTDSGDGTADGTDAGSVLSQGDAAHNGPAARALGTSGAGVKVGVISDSMNQVGGGLAASQASGDLPSSVTILADDTGASDEGRAMAEIIYDGAPGISQMYFSTGTISAVGKANSIANLVAQGVKVIADDIFYLDEPMFQDGVIAQAVDAAKASGVTYLASAGNRAKQSWEGSLTLSGSDHDFDPSGAVDTVQTLGTFTNRTPFIALQWAEPWGGASTNIALDFYVDGVLVGSPDSNNITSGLPLEFEQISISGTHTLGIGIRRVAGTGTPLMKYIVGGVPAFTVNQFPTNSNAINPDAASAAGSLAIAASSWASPTLPQAYSSRGPAITRLFNTSGTPVTPIVRPKPALAAADAVSTTVPGFQPFGGTSAATPSAAAIAALVRSANPDLTVDQVAAILTSPANALDCPGTAGQPDLDCGSGFLLADRAVRAVDSTPPVVSALVNPATPNGTGGWYTGSVNVSYAVVETGSVLVSQSGCGPTSVTVDGTFNLVCAVQSIGGIASATVTIRRDASAPQKLKFKGIKKNYTNGAVPVASKVKCKAKDPTSGVKSCKVKGLKTTKGTHKLKATAINNAGLKTKATFTYTIS